MARQGLSLVGFLTPEFAAQYLLSRCVLDDRSPAALEALWTEARSRLGTGHPQGGRPEVRDIPGGHAEYLRAVERSPRFAATVGTFAGWSFKQIEIAPLLAFQFDIADEAPEEGEGRPGPAEMLKICLPHRVEEAPCFLAVQGSSLLVYSNDPNLCILHAGASGGDVRTRTQQAGITYGVASPLALVAHLEGHYYLRNGCHRFSRLARRGVTAAPCVLVEARDHAQLGIPNGFDPGALRSAGPPTCGHFAQGRAYPVALREVRRVIQVTWSEYTLHEPDWS